MTSGAEVRKNSSQSSAWPSRLQELLIRATLLTGDDAVDVWTQWLAEADLHNIEPGSKRLLAATYTNLVSAGIDHPFMAQMKEQKQQTWLENNLLFHQAETAIQILAGEGISTMLAKGAALVLRHYGEYGLRPMADFDVVVPTVQSEAAIAALKSNGFNLMPEHSQLSDLSHLHAVTFVTDIGRQIDLHWRVISGTDENAPFWEHAEPVVLGNTQTLVMSPTELLLHVCVHGVRSNPVPPIRWILDSSVIIRGREVDWDRLVRLARGFRFSHRMQAALDYLHRLGIPVPVSALEQLSNQEILGFEKLEFECITRVRNKSLSTQLAVGWLRFERFSYGQTGFSRIRRLPEYLRSSWSVKSNWQLPILAVRKAIRRRTVDRDPG